MLLIALSVVDEMLGCRLCARLAVLCGMTRVEWFVICFAVLVLFVSACCAPCVLMIVALMCR